MTESEFDEFLLAFKSYLGDLNLISPQKQTEYYRIVGGALIDGTRKDAEICNLAQLAKKEILAVSPLSEQNWADVLIDKLKKERKSQREGSDKTKSVLLDINRYGNGVFSAALLQVSAMLKQKDAVNSDGNLPFNFKSINSFTDNINRLGYLFDSSTNRYIKSLLAKPFVILTGNSGTGKSKMATLFADWLVGKGGYAFVPVGADWTDNRNVLGYVNMLKEKTETIDGTSITAPVFQATEVVKLLVRAHQNWERGTPTNPTVTPTPSSTAISTEPTGESPEQSKEEPPAPSPADPARKPYFLILDEMNLSHVERYFSDFLAHIESPDQEIRLHHEEHCLLYLDDPTDPKKGKWIDLPQTIKLPPNLFVVGTVNVDETTYMFSPKVLDRANVIEFRTSKRALTEAQDKEHKPSSKIEELGWLYSDAFLELSLRARGIENLPLDPPPEDTTKTPSEGSWADYKKAISEVFDILQRRGLEFGFRVQKEMLAYARVDYHFQAESGTIVGGAEPSSVAGLGASAWDWQRCFDEQMMQKVLPKLHGDQAKLEAVLAALIVYCRTGKTADDAKKELTKISDLGRGEKDFDKLEAIESGKDTVTARFPLSFVKLSRMMEVLRRDQFVSYIH